MVFEFETGGVAPSTEAATNRSETGFQNEIHLKHHSGRGDIVSNNAIMSSMRAGNIFTAKINHSVKGNSQYSRESFEEDTGSLFSFKTTSTSRNDSCDIHDGFGKLSRNNKSKGVHKISTPWLVAERKKSSATRYGNSDYKKDGNNKKNGIEVVPSIQDNHITADNTNTATKKQSNSRRSVLCGRRLDGSVTDNISSTSEPTMSSTGYDESSSHHLYHIFPDSTSGDFTSGEIQRTANGDRDDIYINDKEIVESTQPSTNHKMNNRQCGENKNHNKSIESQNHNNELSPFIDSGGTKSIIMNTHKDKTSTTMMVSSAISVKNRVTSNINSISRNNMPIASPRTEQIVCAKESSEEHQHPEFRTISYEENRIKCRETNITTPRRRNGRSPSPSRLRGQLECKKSVAHQNEKFESQRNVTPDYNREVLMGLEMRRDLDRMSLFKCGATGGGTRGPLYSGKERKPSRKDSKRFSILPSSMFCLNPTLQLDGIETTEDYVHSTNMHDENNRVWGDKSTSSSTRSKPTTNNFCNGASSALLLDIKDDDPFWKYYDDMKPMHRSSNTEKTRAEIRARESREFESEHHYTQNLAIEDPTYHRHSFSTSREDSLRNDKSRDASLGKEHISMSENDKESRFRYESLMNYPEQSRWEKEEFQPSKEALLNQMRHAVQKASAQLDSREIVKAIDSSSEERYRVMTMETECSDESTSSSDYPEQQGT
jgi:hypothetical protein